MPDPTATRDCLAKVRCKAQHLPGGVVRAVGVASTEGVASSHVVTSGLVVTSAGGVVAGDVDTETSPWSGGASTP
jgi:hypothetical protein